MTPLASLVLLSNVVVNTAGHLLFKAAAVETRAKTFGETIKSYAANGLIWLGVVCFILEFIIWLALVSLIPLSQAVMLGCAAIIGVMAGGRVFFGETLNRTRMTAILLISLGVVLVGWGNG